VLVCLSTCLCALQPLQIVNGTVEFQDVVFGYGKQRPPDNDNGGSGAAATAGGGGNHEDQGNNNGHESAEENGTTKHSRESTPEKGDPDGGNGHDEDNGQHDAHSTGAPPSTSHPEADLDPLPGPFQQHKLGLSKRGSTSLLTGLGRWVL
jgi:hypothetical protein